MSLEIEFQNAYNLIQRNQKFLILPSSPPDGDSIGSALALFFVLKKLGKEVTAVCHDPIPDVYKFLHPRDVIKEDVNINRDFIVTLDSSHTKVDHIRYQVEHNKVNIVISPKQGTFNPKDVSFHYGEIKFDCLIVVDAGDLEQLGVLYSNNPEIFYNVPVINIDHHASNNYFGKINMVDITASSTTEIIYQFFKKISADQNLIEENVATALLSGIITDTGSFQHANTTPRSLEIAAELVNLGAHQQEIIKNVYKTKQLSTLKLWGRILSKLKVDAPHRMIWSVITLKDFQETNSHPDEVGDIIDDLLTNDPDAEVVLILKEKKTGLISGSLRTTTNAVDASKIAEMFGGGGHTRAAGFRISSSNFSETELQVVNTIRSLQHQRLFGENLSEKISEPSPAAATLILQPQTNISDKLIAPPSITKTPEKKIKELTKKFFAKENGTKIDVEGELSSSEHSQKDVSQILTDSIKKPEPKTPVKTEKVHYPQLKQPQIPTPSPDPKPPSPPSTSPQTSNMSKSQLPEAPTPKPSPNPPQIPNSNSPKSPLYKFGS